MTPMPPASNKRDRANADIKSSRQMGAVFGRRSNKNYIGIGEFSSRLFYPLQSVATSFTNFVCVVLGISAQPQMRWVHTLRIVAGMANAEIAWVITRCQLVGDTMRTQFQAKLRPHQAVALSTNAPKPRPAFVWSAFIHTLPEVLRNSNWFASTHLLNLSQGGG